MIRMECTAEGGEGEDHKRYLVYFIIPGKLRSFISHCIIEVNGYYIFSSDRWRDFRKIWPIILGAPEEISAFVYKAGDRWLCVWPRSGTVANLKRDVAIPFPGTLFQYLKKRGQGLPEWAVDEIIGQVVADAI